MPRPVGMSMAELADYRNDIKRAEKHVRQCLERAIALGDKAVCVQRCEELCYIKREFLWASSVEADFAFEQMIDNYAI